MGTSSGKGPLGRTSLIAAGAIVVLALAFGVFRLLAPHGPFAPDFTLTAANGQPFRLSHERGRAVALFFGYTHCPDVCPATLAALARAKKLMAPAKRDFDVVFITVDPARDTTSIVGRYVHLFDPSFIGLTGTTEQLAPVYAAYHIYHQQLPARDSAAGYLVAHSSIVQFVGPDGTLRGFGDWGDTPQQLAADIAKAES
jgi:protein SCO1/2